VSYELSLVVYNDCVCAYVFVSRVVFILERNWAVVFDHGSLTLLKRVICEKEKMLFKV